MKKNRKVVSHMKRIVSLLLVLALTCASFGALAESTPTIKWLHHYGEDSARAWVQEVTDAFTAETGVAFDVQATSSDNYDTLLKAKIASSDAPDIFSLDATDIPNYIRNNYLADLSGLEFWNTLVDGTAASTQMDGKNYFFPFEFSAAGAFYNMDVFEAAGITALPTTYTEFMAVLQKLKDYGVTPIAFGSQERWTIVNDFRADLMATLLKNNPNYVDDMQNRKAKFADDDLMKDMMTKFKARYAYGNADPFGTDWNKATQMVASGEAAMVINGNWAAGAIQEKNPDVRVGAFAVPATDNPEDTTLTVWLSSGFVIYNDSPVKEQCIEFFKKLAGTDSGNFWMTQCKRLSSIKGLDASDDTALNAINQYLDKAQIFDTSSITPEFSDEYGEALLDVFTLYLMDEIKDVDEAAAQLDARFDEVYLKQH